jgi:hypothetical protein
MGEKPAEEWFLDWSALPDRLIWARLRVFSDGSAAVLDCDGRTTKFDNREAATEWLNEDEYSLREHLVGDGEVPATAIPPNWP